MQTMGHSKSFSPDFLRYVVTPTPKTQPIHCLSNKHLNGVPFKLMAPLKASSKPWLSLTVP